MKRFNYSLLLPALTLLLNACSNPAEKNDGGKIAFDKIELHLGDKNAESASSRAVSEFVVNKAEYDPTKDASRLAGGMGWNLDVSVYDYSGAVYAPASGAWTYDGAKWVNGNLTQLYLPSYVKPRVEATLFPLTATETVALDQTTAANLLQQDILVQRSNNQYVTPAHIVLVEMRHKHSMIDFMLVGVNTDDIARVTVEADGNTYLPYNVEDVANEYLLILPEGVAAPVVNLETNDGARYHATLNIASTQRNHCYCIKLTGLELLLSSVTVVNWAVGTALSGEYTTPASYPTFRGAPNITITLSYDNGVTQDITFNERGEATVKPLGRTIVAINRFPITPPIILDKMYVDLTDYISEE